MLGGGHGWLQGQYGLMADNLVSARLALANGSLIAVSDKEHADLFWALRGAGHNFGIVTSFEYKVYDRTKENERFSIDTMIFTGDKLEDVFTEQNRMLTENRPVELAMFAQLFPMPDIDRAKVRPNCIQSLRVTQTDDTSPSSFLCSSGKAHPFPKPTASLSPNWSQSLTQPSKPTSSG